MNTGRYVLSQVLDLVHRQTLDRLAQAQSELDALDTRAGLAPASPDLFTRQVGT